MRSHKLPDEAGSSSPLSDQIRSSQQTAHKWRRRVLSLPGALCALLSAGLITAAITFYSPGLFHHLSTSKPALLFHLEDVSAPPFTLVLPSGNTKVATPPSSGCDGFRHWALTNGGIDAQTSNVALVVQGNTDQNVYVESIQADVVSRLPLRAGARVTCSLQGAVTPQSVSIDLDRSNLAYQKKGEPTAPFGYTVGKTETIVFAITVTAAKADYKWALEVRAVVAGKGKAYRIDNSGVPFETTGSNRASTSYGWENGGWTRYASGRQPAALPADSLLMP